MAIVGDSGLRGHLRRLSLGMGSRPSLRWARGLADVGEGWAGRGGVGSSLSDAHLRLHLDSSRGPCASVSSYAQSGATNHAPGAVWTQRALLLLRSECGLCRSSQYPGRQTPREGENLSSAHSEIRSAAASSSDSPGGGVGGTLRATHPSPPRAPGAKPSF